MKPENKKAQRLLRGIGRRAARELEKLRSIADTPEPLHYFYDVLESVYVQNNPLKHLDPEHTGRLLVGLYCMVVPEELIYAAGAIPVRLCAGCFESSLLGEDRVPRDGCSLVKSAVGLTMQPGLALFDCCDLVIVPTTCDGKRKMGEELSAFTEVWMLEVPHLKHADSSRRLWLEQLHGLKRQLEQRTAGSPSATPITPRNLAQQIGAIARAQAQMRRLLSLRAQEQPPLQGRQALAVANAYGYTQVREWTLHLDRLNSALEARPPKAAAASKDDHEIPPSPTCRYPPRILIAGSPSIFPALKIPSLVEEMGGIVVCDESCAGDRMLYDPVGPTEMNLRSQITALASRYLAPCTCPSFSPNSDRLLVLQRLCADYTVDGMLYHVLKGCVVYDFEVQRVERTMQELGIPVLRIETDYNPEDVEQLRTRVEAFLEMLLRKRTKQREKNNDGLLCRN